MKWYNILSFRFIQPSTSDCANLKQRHDKQESDISMYRGGAQTQNTKEESSDESTIISSQTSTLTRNQECEELQNAVSMRLEGLVISRKSSEDDDIEEEVDSDSDSEEDSDSEDGIIVEFMEDNVLQDVLEHEVGFSLKNQVEIEKVEVIN